ncbi:hypothetical protein X980_4285 [Burkholderia pseudomallei MSHR4000]|nr:hypothetical protein X980_4285 [Burkholderia pseudomallei MSHR4000]
MSRVCRRTTHRHRCDATTCRRPTDGSSLAARGSRLVVRGSWFVVRGSWFVVRGSWLVVRGSWFVARGSRLTAHGSRLTVRDSQFATHSSRGRAIRLYLGGTQGQAHRRRREKEPPRDRSAQSPKLERTAAMAASRMATCDRGIAASTMSPLERSRAFRDCARTDASARARMQPAPRERHFAGRSGSQCDVSAMSSARSPADRPSTRRRALLPGIDRVEPELRMASCGGEWSTESAIESSSGSSIEFSTDCRICRARADVWA